MAILASVWPLSPALTIYLSLYISLSLSTSLSLLLSLSLLPCKCTVYASPLTVNGQNENCNCVFVILHPSTVRLHCVCVCALQSIYPSVHMSAPGNIMPLLGNAGLPLSVLSLFSFFHSSHIRFKHPEAPYSSWAKLVSLFFI